MTVQRITLNYLSRCSTVLYCKQYSTHLSYKHNFGEEHLCYRTIGSVLEQTAHKFSHRKAIIAKEQQKSLTFAELLTQADKLAAAFKCLDLEKGDRVGLWTPNLPEWYITNMACARAGLITVSLNPNYQPPEIEYCINKVGIKAIVCADAFRTQDYYQQLATVAPEIKKSDPGKLKSGRIPSLQSVISLAKDTKKGAFAFDEVLELATDDDVTKIQNFQRYINPDDPYYIKFTSGTTGKPKAALLTHANYVNNAYFFGKRVEMLDNPHIVCVQVPFFHVAGALVLNYGLTYGSTLVVPSQGYNPNKSLDAIIEEKCTMLTGTPTMYVDLVQLQQQRQDNLSIEIAIFGGSPSPPQLIQQVKSTLNVKKVTMAYGLTEATTIAFLSLRDEDNDKVMSTAGYIGDHLEAKVIDSDGNLVPFGTPGQLCLRGYSIMLGYWNDEEKTKASIGSDRWLKTGDTFVLEEDGYGKVVGRLHDMILRGGENIYPVEIEDVLSCHPDILQVAVIGLPHDRLGEELCACVRLKPGSEMTKQGLEHFCKQKIARSKIPSQLRVVEDFPKTASGKINKIVLKEMIVKSFRISNI